MPTALVLVRAVQFWSVAVLLGGGGLLWLCCGSRRGTRLLRVAAATVALSGVAWLALTLVGMTDTPTSLLTAEDWRGFFAQQPFGPAWALRLALLGACVAILPARHPGPYVAAGIALALDQAWLGHAGAGIGATGVILVLFYWAHVVAGLGWVGALMMLVGIVRDRDPDSIAAALACFSTLGVVLVAIVAASGIANAMAHLDGLGDLVRSSYGRLVATKFGLFLGMLALATLNRTAARRGELLRSRLAVGVVSEAIIGILIVGVAAALGVTAPP